MKFSICSWIFGNEKIDKVMQFVSRAGYDAIEIRAAVDEYNWGKLLNLSKELSLKIGGLTGDTNWPNEKQDLANPSAHNRREAINYFKRQIEVVRIVQGDYLVVCPTAVGKITPQQNAEDEWKWAVDSVQQLAEKAEELDITLVIEPLNRYESFLINTSEDALRFVKEINHPRVRMLLDSYHMNIEEVDMKTPLIKAKEHLEILHVSDSNRQALGRGHINFVQFANGVKDSGFNGYVVVECMAPGPNPFQPNKGYPHMEKIYTYAIESLEYLKRLLQF